MPNLTISSSGHATRLVDTVTPTLLLAPLTRLVAGRKPSSLASCQRAPKTIIGATGLPVTGTIGVVRSDLVRRPAVRFRVAITRATYNHAVNRIYRLRTSWKTYGLLGPNCNSFVGDVAASIGLRTPIMTAQYPVNYVSELRAFNSR